MLHIILICKRSLLQLSQWTAKHNTAFLPSGGWGRELGRRKKKNSRTQEIKKKKNK